MPSRCYVRQIETLHAGMPLAYVSSMELRHLRHFLAVLEHGSILRAAEAVHLTQPALSRSIQTLEGELDVRLLERGRRGIAPTPHGLLLARHARTLVAQAEEARAALRGLRTDGSAHLAVGVGTHLAGLALPRVIAALVAELPRLSVGVRDGNGEELIEALQRGQIDVALCAWPADGVPPDLVFEELLRSDLAVACGAAHPLARRRRVSLAELSQRRWALAERPRAIGEVFRLAFAAAGLPQPQPVVRSTSLPFLLALLQETDLISLLPAGYLEAAPGTTPLVRLGTDLPAAATRIGTLRRAGDTELAPVLQSFVEALPAALRRRAARRGRGS